MQYCMHPPSALMLVGGDSSWLIRTDVILGFFTVLCLIVVAVVIAGDIIRRSHERKVIHRTGKIQE
jgi:hypothetical protein